MPLSRRGEEAPSRDRPLLESPAAPFASVGGNGGGGGREGSLSPSSEVIVRERERCYVLRVCGEVGGGACARKKKAAERGGEGRKERGELLFFSAVERDKWNQQRQAAPLASHPLRAHLCSLSHPFEEKKTAQVRFFLVVPLLSSRSSCSQRRTSSLPLAPRSLRQRRRESESETATVLLSADQRHRRPRRCLHHRPSFSRSLSLSLSGPSLPELRSSFASRYATRPASKRLERRLSDSGPPHAAKRSSSWGRGNTRRAAGDGSTGTGFFFSAPLSSPPPPPLPLAFSQGTRRIPPVHGLSRITGTGNRKLTHKRPFSFLCVFHQSKLFKTALPFFRPLLFRQKK